MTARKRNCSAAACTINITEPMKDRGLEGTKDHGQWAGKLRGRKGAGRVNNIEVLGGGSRRVGGMETSRAGFKLRWECPGRRRVADFHQDADQPNIWHSAPLTVYRRTMTPFLLTVLRVGHVYPTFITNDILFNSYLTCEAAASTSAWIKSQLSIH
jgi:hypothetical protein